MSKSTNDMATQLYLDLWFQATHNAPITQQLLQQAADIIVAGGGVVPEVDAQTGRPKQRAA